MTTPSTRNSVGRPTIVSSLIGALLVAIGIRVAAISRIDLLTAHTSYPYLGIGIPLVLVGVVLIVVAQQTAKRQLRKSAHG